MFNNLPYSYEETPSPLVPRRIWMLEGEAGLRRSDILVKTWKSFSYHPQDTYDGFTSSQLKINMATKLQQMKIQLYLLYWEMEISINPKYTHPLLVMIGYVRVSGWISRVVEAIHSSRSNTSGWWACWLTPAQTGTKDPSGKTLDSAGPLKSSGKKMMTRELLLER